MSPGPGARLAFCWTLSYSISLLISIATAWTLPVWEYGILAIAFVGITLAQQLADLGSAASLTRFTARATGDDRPAMRATAMRLAAVSGLGWAGALAASAPLLAASFPAPGLARLTLLGGGVVALWTFEHFLLAVENGLGELALVARVKALESTVQLSLFALCMHAGLRPEHLLYGLLCGHAAALGTLLPRALARGGRPGARGGPSAAEVFRYGAPLGISQAVSFAGLRLQTWIVGLNAGAVSSAHYNLADRIVQIPLSAAGFLREIWTARFPPLWSRGDTGAIERALRRWLCRIAAAGICGILLVLLLGPALILRFMPSYAPSAAVLGILSPLWAVQGMALVGLDALGVSTGRAGLVAGIRIAAGLSTLGLVVLASRFGIAAVASATAFAQTTVLLGGMLLLLRRTGLKPWTARDGEAGP